MLGPYPPTYRSRKRLPPLLSEPLEVRSLPGRCEAATLPPDCGFPLQRVTTEHLLRAGLALLRAGLALLHAGLVLLRAGIFPGSLQPARSPGCRHSLCTGLPPPPTGSTRCAARAL